MDEIEKAIITVGYNDYVLDLDDAVQLMRTLNKAEVYKHQWHEGRDYTHHIYSKPSDMRTNLTIKLLSADTYRIAKLAGEPEDK